jgi:2',3'-cyclic-nucleotide 2'-phosphodiesterase (5'-nucleotidase family)
LRRLPIALLLALHVAGAACAPEEAREPGLDLAAARAEPAADDAAGPDDGASDPAARAEPGAGSAPEAARVRTNRLTGAVTASTAEPSLIVAYSASSQGFLEPCGCGAKGTEMGGIARRATVVERLREGGAPVLLVEAGDFAGGPGEAGVEIARAFIRAMAAMDYDAVAFGEAELALGEEFLSWAAREGPALARTNWSHPAVGPAQSQGLLVRKGDLLVGVIGLLDPEALPDDLPLENLVVEPPGPAAAAAARALRAAGADLVVVLGHADFRRSGRVAADAGVPDLWIVGHGGKELTDPVEVAGVRLLGAGNVGKLLGVLELELPRGAPARLANRLEHLEMEIPEQPAVASIVRRVNPAILHQRAETPASRS